MVKTLLFVIMQIELRVFNVNQDERQNIIETYGRKIEIRLFLNNDVDFIKLS